MTKRYLFITICVASVLLMSCASVSDKERASRYVSSAWQESCLQISNEKMMLRTRHNPSPCDHNLKYEVELYGQFRHVQITGSDELLSELAAKADSKTLNEVFEYPYLLSGEIYTSSCGQQHYVLVLGDGL